jgi:hypothetical protein
MFERIKLDPLVNRRVIFKLRCEASTMDATILGYDDAGYWIKGGTLAEHLKGLMSRIRKAIFVTSKLHGSSGCRNGQVK